MPNPNPLTKVPDEDHSMATEEPTKGRCNSELEDGQFCARYPALTEEGELVYEDGVCFFCAGGEDGNTSSTHQLYAKRSEFFKTLSPYEQAQVDELIQSMEEQADYEPPNKVKSEIVRQIGIDIAKVWRANDYIAEEGMQQRKTVDLDEDGHPVKEDVENIMNVPVDRLSRSIVSRMKDLSIITDSEEKKAEEIRTLAEVLSGE